MSFGSQMGLEERFTRAAGLNNDASTKVVFRAAHELGMSAACQSVLNSGKPGIRFDGHRSVCCEIQFPEELTDKVFGKKGVLHLNAVGWQCAHASSANEVNVDLFWHVSLKVDVDDPRCKARQGQDETDYLASATKGVTSGFSKMKF